MNEYECIDIDPETAYACGEVSDPLEGRAE